MKDNSADLERDVLTNEPTELNSASDPMLSESYINQKRPHYSGGFYRAIKNLNQVELPDSSIPDEIAMMDEHIFPEK